MMLATGITALIGVQFLINLLVVTSTMPPTGVPLPFISAGNTSLIVFMAAVGVLLNVSRFRLKT
jgi:cell division protein FtsW